MRFGADYYPEHWPRERWETDARLMAEAGLEGVRLAEFAWSRLEPEQDRFDFGWLDDALEVLGRAGLKAVLGTPGAAPPAWLIERYPEALPVREDGMRLGFGGRHHDCQSNPDYRARVAAVVRAMAEHYKDNPRVIGWQIDNELGNSHLNVCTCDTCRAGFCRWLERKYGTIDRLNEAWGTVFWSQTYSSFAQIPAPRPTPNSHNPSLRLDWRRFTSDLVIGFQSLQVAILREVCPKHFVTHNFMGLFDKPDYFELAKELDFVSHDQYPIGFWTEGGALPDAADLAIKLDFVRGLKRRTYWIMEQQAGPAGWDLIGPTPRPGQLRLWAAQSIAHGADTVVYFRWRTCLFGTEEYWHGILPHSGKPGRRYDEVRRTSVELSPIMDRIKGKAPRADAAILFSYDQSWANQIQPHHPELKYREHIRGFYKALHRANVPVDFVSPETELDGYKLVVAPMLFLTRPELAARLDAYVRAGGHLVLSLRSGVKDWDNKALAEMLPGPFAKLLGIEIPDYDCLRSVAQGARWCAAGFPATSEAVSKWADIVVLKGAEPLALYTDDYYRNMPAVTRHSHGKGSAVYVATELGPMMNADLIEAVTGAAGVRGLGETPEGVEVARRPGDDGDYTFVLNHTAAEARVAIPQGWHPLVAPPGGKAGELVLPPYEIAVLRSPR